MNASQTNETVLVTGGSGYLAGWILSRLLQEGYAVRTTLRNNEGQAEIRAALGTQGVPFDRLSFVTADLLHDDGWHAAVSGCEYVMHVASPMGQGQPKGTDIVRPAQEGTLRVLRAAASNGVRRIVCTSSGLAAQAPATPGTLQQVADEKTWTDLAQPGLSEYARSKTFAEKAAWDFIESDSSGMTLTSVLPGVILGPLMTQKASPSFDIISRLLTGKAPALPHVGFSITDTRDLVDLHLRAMSDPAAANQRFIGMGEFLWLSEIAEILRKQFPSHAAKIATRKLPNWIVRLAAPFQQEARFMLPILGKRREYDSSKAAAVLGWHARPSREAVIECAQSLISCGPV